MSEKILKEAKTWLGTPYHHQGRIKGVGVDCATFLCAVFEKVGLTPYIDPTPYPIDWHFHRGEERYLSWLDDYGVEVDDPQPGDVAIYKFGRCFSHAGIIVDDDMIVHSYIGQGVVYENRSAFAKRETKYYRVGK